MKLNLLRKACCFFLFFLILEIESDLKIVLRLLEHNIILTIRKYHYSHSFLDPISITTVISNSQTYFAGETISMSGCSFESMFETDITISLIRDQHVVNSNVTFEREWVYNNSMFVLTTGPFHIQNVNITESGSYWCQVDYSGQKVKSHPTQIFVNGNSFMCFCF